MKGEGMKLGRVQCSFQFLQKTLVSNETRKLNESNSPMLWFRGVVGLVVEAHDKELEYPKLSGQLSNEGQQQDKGRGVGRYKLFVVRAVRFLQH